MQITRTVLETRAALARLRDRQPRPQLGLVPTMGALHAGHMSLVAAAKAECDLVVASIFVNPLQFGPAEDLTRYPQTFNADCELLEAARVDLLFAPAVNDIYPRGQTGVTTIDVPALSSRLDGASRPGHFRGVATVVAKLFGITTPNLAFFGQKDAAQVAVLRRMTADLNLPIALRVCPIVRDSDGLALSSRNRYLSPAERTQALVLSRALRIAEQHVITGITAAAALEDTLRDTIATEAAVRLDYAAVIDPYTLAPVPDVQNGALLAVAAWVGDTRLIDNVLLPAAAPATHSGHSEAVHA